MATRDDFYALDEFSFGECLNILDTHTQKRFQLEAFLAAIEPDNKITTLNALAEYLKTFGKTRAVQINLGIIDQIKKEISNSEAD